MTSPRFAPLSEITTVTQGIGLSGRAAGARAGDWAVKLVGVGAIQDGQIQLDRLETVNIEENERTRRYLLEPYDVLVTARSSLFKAALVPPLIERTVADATLNIVRVRDADLKPYLGPYLWWYLTSSSGRQQAEALMAGVGIPALTVQSLERLVVPVPPAADLPRLADLIETSERAYLAGREALQLRRNIVRDAIIQRLEDQAK